MDTKKDQDILRKLLSSLKIEPFIRHIRFPQYKNLAKDTKIEFSYPITVLVGANGTNKSSILRALFGAPGYNNLGNYWFSTKIDPIEETGGRPNCFIYGYWNNDQNAVVEVLKTRVKKENDPDYWEPSRPIIDYAMKRMPKLEEDKPTPEGRSKTRWKTIEKKVVYIDFRASLSAYDKFFYHGDLRSKNNSEKEKKDFVRTRAPHLKKALDLGLSTHVYRKSERLFPNENRSLSERERNAVSCILGREYSEIKIIRHTFFNCDAATCLMQVPGLQYSEAFAGSGEFAVVKIVTDVASANDGSLILLDEPEVSLHPGAQDRLLDFLMDSVKRCKHQIVIATHSPAIVRKLPPDAIKVLVMDSSGKVFLPNQSALPEEAFFHLGEPISSRKTIIVEDALAEALVRRALSFLGEAISTMFDILYFPGGSATVWKYYLPIYAAEKRENLLVLFDGDMRPESEMRNPNTIPSADEENIASEIQRVAKVKIEFQCDGGAAGADKAQRSEMQRAFMSWVRRYVRYLPGDKNPETFIWQHMQHDPQSDPIADTDAKIRFEKLTRTELGIASYQTLESIEILQTQRRRLATIPETNPDFSELKDLLQRFANLPSTPRGKK